MSIKKGKYFIPNEAGTDYEQISLETSADSVVETNNKNFVSKEDKDFVSNNKANILQSKDISTGFENSKTKVASSASVYELMSALGGGNIEIVISKTQPAKPSNGKTILWIEE